MGRERDGNVICGLSFVGLELSGACEAVFRCTVFHVVGLEVVSNYFF